jgi:hypothetical protein
VKGSNKEEQSQQPVMEAATPTAVKQLKKKQYTLYDISI